LTSTLFSRSMFGVWVHFDQIAKRSSPHYTEETRCPGCQDQHPKRWKGFVHAFCVEKKQSVFLELTPASANALLGQLVAGETLRGKHIVVERSAGKNGRLSVRVMPYMTAPPEMPEELDPERSLKALWGLIDKPRGGREFPRNGPGFLPKTG